MAYAICGILGFLVLAAAVCFLLRGGLTAAVPIEIPTVAAS